MSDREIYDLLFKNHNSETKKPRPNLEYIHQEMKKKNVTLELLWEEFIEENPKGIGYPRLAQIYSDYQGTLDIALRQSYKYGEKCFLDFAGHKISIKTSSGESFEAEIFVAVMAASNYTFACAVRSQSLENWIDCNIKALEFFQGVPEEIIHDNLKSAVSKAHRYEPDLNPTYQDFAIHYQAVIFPTRPYKPKDKAKVEKGVQHVERWILAALRNRNFSSLHELNIAIAELLEKLNNKALKIQKVSRKELFFKNEKHLLKPLPEKPYELSKWKKLKVPKDYHLEIEGHYYSVPFHLISQSLDIAFNNKSVTIFKEGKIVARHLRSFHLNQKTTNQDHLPKKHKNYSLESKETLLAWASTIGPNSLGLFREMLAQAKQNYLPNFSSAKGIKRLAKNYSPQRLETAIERLLSVGIGAKPCKSLREILENNLDLETLEEPDEVSAGKHENIRGSEYYFSDTDIEIKEASICL